MKVNGYTIAPGANLREADLSGTDLSEANLSGANLRGANLSGTDLSEANLSEANLSEANLRGANLRGANLSEANLRGANLRGANLRGANLSEANLRGANLRGANLSGTNLSEANLRGANLSEANLRWAENVPELPWTIIVPEGDLIVYKKVSSGIAKLCIPKEAKRVNATSRKCRASFAIVLECPPDAYSCHDPGFKYTVGERVTPTTPFNENRWEECSSGIHFFLTKYEAEHY